MQEKYIHYLWRMKRLNFNAFTLINQPDSSIVIEDVGWYNTDSGPDFFNGRVSIDGITWQGNIEIHIRSSDWYAHQHHLDRAYDNVILHVVYEYDKEVYINGEALPTIELKNQIQPLHYQYYLDMLQQSHLWKIPCHAQAKDYSFAFSQQMNVSFLSRIERKGLELLAQNKERAIHDLFIKMVLKSVGGKTNQFPFVELANNIDYKVIQKESWNILHLEALFYGVAGFLNGEFLEIDVTEHRKIWQHLKRKYQLSEMNPITWKFGGVRRYSFPTILLAQIASLVSQFKLEDIRTRQPQQLVEDISSLKLHSNLLFIDKYFPKGLMKQTFFPSFINNLLINGVLPFYVALKHLYNDFSFMEKAIELAEILPAEENKIINYWKKIGISPRNALESQGLIELKNEFCNFKKCLSCKVGIAIFENANEKVNSENNILL